MASGTLTVSVTAFSDTQITKYEILFADVGDPPHEVNGHQDELSVIQPGYLQQFEYVAGAFLATLTDINGIDLLAGAMLPNHIETVRLTHPIFYDGSGLDVIVPNVDENPLHGTLRLWIGLTSGEEEI